MNERVIIVQGHYTVVFSVTVWYLQNVCHKNTYITLTYMHVHGLRITVERPLSPMGNKCRICTTQQSWKSDLYDNYESFLYIEKTTISLDFRCLKNKWVRIYMIRQIWSSRFRVALTWIAKIQVDDECSRRGSVNLRSFCENKRIIDSWFTII